MADARTNAGRLIAKAARAAVVSAPLVIACGAAMVAEHQFRFIPDFGPFEWGHAPTVAASSQSSASTATTVAEPGPAPSSASSRSDPAVDGAGVVVNTAPEPPPLPNDLGAPTTSLGPPPTVPEPPPSTSAPAPGHAPMAVADSATGKAGTTIHIDVLANDSDVDGDLDALSVSVVGATTGPGVDVGSLSIKTRNGRNEIDYRSPQEAGEFTFSYRVCDASGLCATTDVRVVLKP